MDCSSYGHSVRFDSVQQWTGQRTRQSVSYQFSHFWQYPGVLQSRQRASIYSTLGRAKCAHHPHHANQQAYTSYSASGNNTNNTLNVSTRGREYSAASSEVAVATGNATSGLTMTVSSVELGFPTTDSITNLIGFTAEENGSALNDALMHSASQQVSQDNTPMFDSASEDFQSIAMNTSANNSTNNSTSTTRRNSLTNTGAPNLPNRLETIEESTLSMTPSLSASMSPNQTNSRTMLSIRQSSNAGVHQQNTPPISSSATSSGMPSPLPPYSRNDTSTSAINGKSCQISQQLPPTIPANLHSHPSWMMTQQQSLASSMGSSPPEDTPQSGIYQSLLSRKFLLSLHVSVWMLFLRLV